MGIRAWWPIVALSAVANLALPVSCASCAAPDSRVCRDCLGDLRSCLWEDGPRSVAPTPAPRGLPMVFSAGRYEGALARIVGAYKDDGRRDCRPLLTELLASAVDTALGHPGLTASLREGDRPVLVIPVPSSRASRRRRGDAPLDILARRACDGFARDEVRSVGALRPRRRIADQAGLTAAERAVNLEHSMQVRDRFQALVAGSACIVVDDVLTTGATLVEAARALRAAGASEVLAATICATQRRSRPSVGP